MTDNVEAIPDQHRAIFKYFVYSGLEVIKNIQHGEVIPIENGKRIFTFDV